MTRKDSQNGQGREEMFHLQIVKRYDFSKRFSRLEIHFESLELIIPWIVNPRHRTQSIYSDFTIRLTLFASSFQLLQVLCLSFLSVDILFTWK